MLMYQISIVLFLVLTATAAEKKDDAAPLDGAADDAPEVQPTWPPQGLSLDDPPSAWPGHLRPLGASGPSTSLDHRKKGLIHPDTFFNDYVSPSTALVFDTGASLYPSVTKWKVDSYFIDIPHSSTVWLNATTSDGKVKGMKLRHFFQTYNKTKATYQGRTPSFMKVDILYPKPLQCDVVKDLILSETLDLTPGGKASSLQRSAHDQLTCQLLPSDISGLDTERIDLDKYPGLREVEYHVTPLPAGACVYIPAKWFYSVSRPHRSIAHTLSWERPRMNRLMQRKDCGKWEKVPTLVAIKCKDVNDTGEDFTADAAFHFMAFSLEGGNHTYDRKGFLKKMSKEIKSLSKAAEWNDEYAEIYEELFDVIDINKDKVFSQADLDDITEQQLERVRRMLADRMADIADIIQDQEAEKGDVGQATASQMEDKVQQSTAKMTQDMEKQIDQMKRMAKELTGGQEVNPQDLDKMMEQLNEKLEAAKKKIAEEDAAEMRKEREKSKAKPDKRQTGEEFSEPASAYRQEREEAEEILAEEEEKTTDSRARKGDPAKKPKSRKAKAKTASAGKVEL